MKKIIHRIAAVLLSAMLLSATACCAQGIEFVPAEGFTCPEDFPPAEEDIVVTGVFDTYYEDRIMYCTLRDAVPGAL